MPVKGHLKYLSRSIKSVLDQSFKDFEFIIIDNNNKKNIKKIIYSFSKLDNRVKILTKKKGNLSEILNFGIKYSKGRFIARQDTDDFSHKERFKKQIKWFQKDSSRVLCGTNCILLDSNGDKIKNKKLPTKNLEIKKLLRLQNPFIHSSIMVRKNIFKKLNYYNIYFNSAQDYDAWTKISTMGIIGNLNQNLLKYTIHKNSISFKNKYKQNVYALLASSNLAYYDFYRKFKYFKTSPEKEILKFTSDKNIKFKIKFLIYIYMSNLKRKFKLELKDFNIKTLSFAFKFPTFFIKSIIKNNLWGT